MTTEHGVQRTLVLVKPDGVRRGLVGEIIGRLERCGVKLVGARLTSVSRDLAERHYADIPERVGPNVFEQLVEYVTAGPVVALAVEGVDAVQVVRKHCGPTEPASASPGTIRGDLAHHSFGFCDGAGCAIRNLVHASSSPEEAARELALWFREEDLVAYRRSDEGEHIPDSGM